MVLDCRNAATVLINRGFTVGKDTFLALAQMNMVSEMLLLCRADGGLCHTGSVECKIPKTLLSLIDVAGYIQFIQTVTKDDLGHFPRRCRFPVDMQQWHHGYISTQGLHWEWISAAPVANNSDSLSNDDGAQEGKLSHVLYGVLQLFAITCTYELYSINLITEELFTG